MVPFEMKVEGYYLGDSRGRFAEADGHPKMVILAPSAYNWANALGAIQTAMSLLTDISDRLLEAAKSSFVGVSFNWGQAVAWVAFAIFTIQRVSEAILVEGPQNVFKWLKIFDDNGTPHNFASQYASIGHYNSVDTLVRQGDKIRGLQRTAYIGSGRYSWNEKKDVGSTEQVAINNFNRESSLYLSLGDDSHYSLAHKSGYKNHDNSRIVQMGLCGGSGKLSAEVDRELYAQYISLKNYVPDQFGEINSVQWMSTGYMAKLAASNVCKTVYGGDTFLSRFSLKKKFPFFISPMLLGKSSVGDLTPFSYSEQRNVAHPRYYVDYKTDMSKKFGRFEMPTIQSYHNLDCEFSPKMYYTPPSKFYLSYNGIPSFIVESRYNLNHRYATNNSEGDFYPNQSDYSNWTQERVVSITEDNQYHYNPVYSADNYLYSYRTLPATYDPKKYSKLMDHRDRTIYSIPDNSEQDLMDNLTVFKANNYEDFGSSYGIFYGMKSLESGKVLFRFENGFKLHNAQNTIAGTAEDIQIGNGGLFAVRPSEFHKTDLGLGGTQHRAFVSCEFGHIWTDCKRGTVCKVDPGGGNFEIISNAGMKSWFKENLPFDIKKQFPNISNLMLDNAFNGIGIAMVWDSKYSRVLLTKKDVKVKKQYLAEVTLTNDSFMYREDEIFAHDSTYFEDVSWTIGYSPLYKHWISYYSFTPNYYTGFNNYFQSGNNFGDEAGSWSHLLTNKSFLTFYGKANPFKIEVPLVNTPSRKWHNSVQWKIDARRYMNEFDYRDAGSKANFSELTVYNNSESSGKINLKTAEKSNLFQYLPKNNITPGQQDVVSVLEDGIFSANGLFNAARDGMSSQLLWIKDLNNVDKKLNIAAYDYRKKVKDNFRGSYGIARYTHNETQYKMLIEYFIGSESAYIA